MLTILMNLENHVTLTYQDGTEVRLFLRRLSEQAGKARISIEAPRTVAVLRSDARVMSPKAGPRERPRRGGLEVGR